MGKRTLGLIFIGLLAHSTSFAAGGEELYKAKGCVGCHNIDSKLIGPSYKDVANKYAGQADAVEHLVHSIRKGSQGVWGNMPMSPNPVTDEEAKALAEWILTLK